MLAVILWLAWQTFKLERIFTWAVGVPHAFTAFDGVRRVFLRADKWFVTQMKEVPADVEDRKANLWMLGLLVREERTMPSGRREGMDLYFMVREEQWVAYRCHAGFDLWQLAGDHIRSSMPEGGELYASVPGRLLNIKQVSVGVKRQSGKYDYALVSGSLGLGLGFFLGSMEEAQRQLSERSARAVPSPKKGEKRKMDKMY